MAGLCLTARAAATALKVLLAQAGDHSLTFTLQSADVRSQPRLFLGGLSSGPKAGHQEQGIAWPSRPHGQACGGRRGPMRRPCAGAVEACLSSALADLRGPSSVCVKKLLFGCLVFQRSRM